MTIRSNKYRTMPASEKLEIMRGTVPLQQAYIAELYRTQAPDDVLVSAWRVLNNLQDKIAGWELEAGSDG